MIATHQRLSVCMYICMQKKYIYTYVERGSNQLDREKVEQNENIFNNNNYIVFTKPEQLVNKATCDAAKNSDVETASNDLTFTEMEQMAFAMNGNADDGSSSIGTTQIAEVDDLNNGNSDGNELEGGTNVA